MRRFVARDFPPPPGVRAGPRPRSRAPSRPGKASRLRRAGFGASQWDDPVKFNRPGGFDQRYRLLQPARDGPRGEPEWRSGAPGRGSQQHGARAGGWRGSELAGAAVCVDAQLGHALLAHVRPPRARPWRLRPRGLSGSLARPQLRLPREAVLALPSRSLHANLADVFATDMVDSAARTRDEQAKADLQPNGGDALGGGASTAVVAKPAAQKFGMLDGVLARCLVQVRDPAVASVVLRGKNVSLPSLGRRGHHAGHGSVPRCGVERLGTEPPSVPSLLNRSRCKCRPACMPLRDAPRYAPLRRSGALSFSCGWAGSWVMAASVW